MAKPKRTPQQREIDFVETARLYARGFMLHEIAEELCRDRDYTLTKQQISLDLKRLRAQWREAAQIDMDQAVGRELARLDEIERQAWRGWERSLRDAEAHIEGPEGERTERRTRSGDPSYLGVIERCLARRAALLGIEDHSIRLEIRNLQEALDETADEGNA